MSWDTWNETLKRYTEILIRTELRELLLLVLYFTREFEPSISSLSIIGNFCDHTHFYAQYESNEIFGRMSFRFIRHATAEGKESRLLSSFLFFSSVHTLYRKWSKKRSLRDETIVYRFWLALLVEKRQESRDSVADNEFRGRKWETGNFKAFSFVLLGKARLLLSEVYECKA